MATAESERQNGLSILTQKFPDQNPDQARNINLMYLPPRLLNDLVLFLNNKDDVEATRDYRGLGYHFGLDMDFVLYLETYSKNPAKYVMYEGVKKGKSYLDLLVFFIEYKVDRQDLLLNAWPATYLNFQGQGQVRSQGQVRGQGQVTRQLMPAEDSWNCLSSVVSDDRCILSQNDLNYAESVFSSIDNDHYPSNRPVEISTERIADWVIRQSSRRETSERRQPDENTESFELNDFGNISPRPSQTGFNISPGQRGIHNISPEVISNIRDVNFPREDQENDDNEQTFSKSIEADSRNPNIVEVIVHRGYSPIEDRLHPTNNQSDERLYPSTDQSDERLYPSTDQSEERLLPRNNQSDEVDSQGFFPPSIIPPSSHTGERSGTNGNHDAQSVVGSFIPPSSVSGTVNFDPQHDAEIRLGEEAILTPRSVPRITERQRSVKVLVTSVGDNKTSNIVKNLVQDLGRHNFDYVAHLPGELKINPPPNPAELKNILLRHKTWLKPGIMISFFPNRTFY